MYLYSSPNNIINNMTEEEIREWVESTLQRPKALQELPLILTPIYLFKTPQKLRRQSSVIKPSLDAWMLDAKEEDELLRIERRFIPFVEIYIPDTPKGKQFFSIAKAIAEIPMQAQVKLKNENQGYWLKTNHYFYQARGVLFAHKLLGVIPNPLKKQGLFSEYLPETSIRNLDLITNVDLAEYHLIKEGEDYIRQRVDTANIVSPFNKNPFELFLSIKKQAFLDSWNLGPASLEPVSPETKWLSIEEQENFLRKRIRLLEQNPWMEPTKKQENEQSKKKNKQEQRTYKQEEQEYLKFLKNYQCYGDFILALRPRYWELREPWSQYIKTLKLASSAYIDDLYWQAGQPYKAQKISVGEQPHQTRKTRKRQRVKGVVDILGYIDWQWA
ncbi:MAG: hypothetical protein ICV78_13820 [Tolypothrix sp. Co-bin9]|nr:hypothetical protein [Tolypothrix sp. Co-bin9]